MKLKRIYPTPEQRRIFFLPPCGPVLLSGRAGSGKTTSAILRAAQLVNFYQRQGAKKPRVGFFVFNNTLKNYLNTLAEVEIPSDQYEVWTLDKWCRDFLIDHGLLSEEIADDITCKRCLSRAISSIGLSSRHPQIVALGEEFLIEEVHYILGRFGLDTARYLASARKGRGENPIVDDEMKRAIAEELIPNYQLVLGTLGFIDWDQIRDRALSFLQAGTPFERYDVIVVDEAQDLCALQVKIALELVSRNTMALMFIRDSAQRIYKSDYIWDDVALNFDSTNQLNLSKNYRNTKQIALVAASLMRVEQDDEIDILDPELTIASGSKPIWFRGKYSDQKAFLINQVKKIDQSIESVGILHVQNAAALELYKELLKARIKCSILRQDDALDATNGVYISTLHSAKGLEFDHVFIMGYDDFFAPGAMSLKHRVTSAHLSAHRKLLYMAISRARKTLAITSSTDQYSRFLSDVETTLWELM